jgi:Tol biopolymer transport system component
LVDKPAQNATISPDGKWVFYQSTDSPKGVSLTIRPDGSWVANDSNGESTIWKISIDGGRPTQLLNRYSSDPIIARHGNLVDPTISPDGKLIACRYQPDPDKDVWKVAIISIEGIPVQVFDISSHPSLTGLVSAGHRMERPLRTAFTGLRDTAATISGVGRSMEDRQNN